MTQPAERVAHELLLRFIRDAVGDDAVEFAEAPAPISRGFDTEIQMLRLSGAPPELDAPLVARIFRDGETGRPAFETAVQNAIADQGYPAPRVFLHDSGENAIGRPIMLMQRMPGVPLLDVLGPSPILWRLPGLVSRAAAALHALDPEPLRRAFNELGQVDRATPEGVERSTREVVERLGHASLLQLADWLEENRPSRDLPQVICHNDFHPINLMADGGRVSGVVDWSTATLGPAELDLGVSHVIVNEGPIEDIGLPRPAVPLIRLYRIWAGRRIDREYEKLRSVDWDLVGYYEVLRVFHAFSEIAKTRAGGSDVAPGYAWDLPPTRARLLKLVERRTGITVDLD